MGWTLRRSFAVALVGWRQLKRMTRIARRRRRRRRRRRWMEEEGEAEEEGGGEAADK